MTDALNRGDDAKVVRLTDESLGSPRNAATFKKIMVTERNIAWMPQLTKILDQGDAVILVGAMHLPGRYGLIRQLRSKGYMVSAIVIPVAG